MRILTLTNCPVDPNLGSGKTVLRYSEGLRQLGNDVDVLPPSDYEYAYGLSRGKKFRQAIGSYLEVRRRLRSQSYDVVEYYGDEFWLAARWVRRREPRPMLVAHTNGLELLAAERLASGEQGPDPDGLTRLKQRLVGPLHRLASQIAFNSADCFVSLCQLDADYIVHHGILPKDRTAVVNPGLDIEYLERPYSSERGARVGFTGTWIDRKDVKTVAKVMSKILASVPAVELDIFGSAGLSSAVYACFDHSLHSRIQVHPRLSNADLSDRLAKCKVFFFPSVYEGFGMATAEAMARGCVPVVTPTGFGAEITDGGDGFVADFGDASRMEQAIRTLLNDDSVFARMSAAARRRVEAFRWDIVSSALAAHYQRWLGEHRRRSS